MRVIGKMLCWLGLHEWQYGYDFTPQGVMTMRLCDRCCAAEHKWHPAPDGQRSAFVDKMKVEWARDLEEHLTGKTVAWEFIDEYAGFKEECRDYACEACGKNRVLHDFGICDDCATIHLAGDPT